MVDDLTPGLVRVFYRTESFEMPTMFRFSIMTDLIGGAEALFVPSTDAGSLRAVGQFDQGIDTDLQATLGLEYGWRNLVFLRAGKRWMNENNTDYQDFERGLAFGGGLRVPFSGPWKTFVHIDGLQQRFNADHDPLQGKYPLHLWRQNDVLVDSTLITLEPNFSPGPYRLYFGLFAGDRRLPVTAGPANEDRIVAGTLQVR